MAISPEMTQEGVKELKNKCMIHGIVKKVEFLDITKGCVKTFQVTVGNESQSFIFNGDYITEECMVDSIYKTFYQDIPKIGEKIKILSDANYKIIDSNNNDADYELYLPLNSCKSNFITSTSPQIKQNSDYYQLYGIIFVLFIIIIFLVQKLYFSKK